MRKSFLPRVCWSPWILGLYLADKDGVLCREVSGISSRLAQTGAWSEPSSLTVRSPFHLYNRQSDMADPPSNEQEMMKDSMYNFVRSLFKETINNLCYPSTSTKSCFASGLRQQSEHWFYEVEIIAIFHYYCHCSSP